MIYEGTIKYETTTKKGNTKTVRESFLIENAETFNDAEYALYQEFKNETGIDVVSLKRSKIKEIANHGTGKLKTPMFVATLTDVFTDDNGNEKEMNYDIAFFAPNIQEAHNFIIYYTEQGYCMEMRGLKQAKFLDVIEYGSTESLHRD